jgi:hypothetical protein
MAQPEIISKPNHHHNRNKNQHFCFKVCNGKIGNREFFYNKNQEPDNMQYKNPEEYLFKYEPGFFHAGGLGVAGKAVLMQYKD